jgi:dTDP-4-amino-4,6-dideoxygalactose transaminase
VLGGRSIGPLPVPQWPQYRAAELWALSRVLRSRRWGTLGPETRKFEDEFGAYLGVSHCQTIANGTVALEAILRALDIGPGDEVIVPAYTFIATATAVLMVGATPVFADLDPRYNTIDPVDVERRITDRTRAVIPAHIAGFPADLDELTAIVTKHGIALVEDAAQAHGSEWEGRKLGTIGTAGSFSFQLSKNLSAGEGGAVVTEDKTLADRVWSIHHIGRRRGGLWYGHYELSSNYRMTDWQAAVLRAQLQRLEGQIATRERSVALLNESIGAIDGVTIFERHPKATRITHHLYMFRVDPSVLGVSKKETVIRALEAEGIPVTGGYVEIQKQPLFADQTVRRALPDVDFSSISLPATERACKETIWLPQNLLLAGKRTLEKVALGIAKIFSNRDELRKSEQI